MKTLQMNKIFSFQPILNGGRESRGLQQQAIAVQSQKAEIAREGNDHPDGLLPFARKTVISYEINSSSGAIRAKMIDPESGRVLREIEVRPALRGDKEKGTLLEVAI